MLRFVLPLLLCVLWRSEGFLLSPPARRLRSLLQSSTDGNSSGVVSPFNPKVLYPVLSRIANTNWTGNCKYTGADLLPVPIKLVGGVRYDIEFPQGQEHFVKLSSFLTFPNGQTREVVMKGSKTSPTQPLKLTSEDGNGPIYMLLSELAPNTILINEIEEATGRTILTASLSIVESASEDDLELIQVSHEVGEDAKSPIEGHQSWRLYKNRPIEYDDFAARDTTGR